MKLTKRQLQRIIREELEAVLNEEPDDLTQRVKDARAKNEKFLPTVRKQEYRPNPNYDSESPVGKRVDTPVLKPTSNIAENDFHDLVQEVYKRSLRGN